jgi:DNA-binding NtrC family response regulator
MIKILVVESKPETQRSLPILLGEAGYAVAESRRVANAFAKREDFQPDLVLFGPEIILDKGQNLFTQIVKSTNQPKYVVIMIEGEIAAKFIYFGGDSYFCESWPNPQNNEERVLLVNKIVEKHLLYMNPIINHAPD